MKNEKKRQVWAEAINERIKMVEERTKEEQTVTKAWDEYQNTKLKNEYDNHARMHYSKKFDDLEPLERAKHLFYHLNEDFEQINKLRKNIKTYLKHASKDRNYWTEENRPSYGQNTIDQLEQILDVIYPLLTMAHKTLIRQKYIFGVGTGLDYKW